MRLLFGNRSAFMIKSASIGKSFHNQVLLTTGANIALAALGVVTGVISARLLGVQGRGELAAIQLWPSFLAGIALLGVPEALTYFTARDMSHAGRHLASAVSLALLISIPFTIVGYWLMPIFLQAQSDGIVNVARVYLIFLPLSALIAVPYQSLRGLGDFVVWNAMRLLPGLTWLGLLLICSMTHLANAQTLAVGYLCTYAFLFIPVGLTIVRRVPRPYKVDPGSWIPMMRYGVPSALSSIPYALNLRMDQMLMLGFLPSNTLGLYVVAVTWSGAVSPLLNAIGSVIFPRIASSHLAEQRVNLMAQGTRMTVLLAGMLTFCVLIVTPVALPFLFGVDFAVVVPTALVLVIAGGVAGINTVLEESLRGLGHPKAVLLAELIGLVATISLLVLLLRPLGTMGAALASMLAYSGVTVVLLREIQKTTGCSWQYILRPGRQEVESLYRQARLVVTRR
jgi:O-antigen/teichoic acid export membrane protein